MARRRRYKPIARIRRVLLLGLILFVGAMAGYYYSGRLAVEGDADSASDDEPITVGEGVLTVARGFDYEVTDGDELAYRVRADKLVSDVQDRMELDRVDVELPREGGGLVRIRGERATIHLDSKSATLDGDVRARTDDGLELRGPSFEVLRDGRQLVSKAPVTFRKGNEYSGSARELHYTIKKERLILEGEVVIRGLPAADPQAGSLRCDKLTYDRREGTLRLEGAARVARGEEFLESSRLSLSFGADAGDVRSVRAESGVNGRYLPQPAGGDLASRVDFKGRLLYAVFEEGTRQARQAELHGRTREDATLEMIDESGLSRLLAAPVVNAEFERGEIAVVDASEPVVIVERHSFAPAVLLRRMCSERAHVDFDDLGAIDKVTLTGSVDYQATDMQARGDRVDARAAGSTATVVGKPATVVNARGDLEAPQITYSDSGRLVATEGVRVELREQKGYRLIGGGGGGEPVRVTAREAVWDQEPERVTFSGRVRAWQGRDYLLADEMVGEPQLDRLTATTKVKSVFRRESPGGAAAASPSGDDPIEITAKKLIYEQPLGVITYEGDVRAIQTGRILECERMDVELDDQDEVERLICTGDLLVEHPEQGKEVRGDRAIYVPGSDEVDVTGDPVVLTDDDGTTLKGGRIVYRFDTGAAKIHSRPLAATAGEGGP